MDCSTPGLPVHHQLRELTKIMSIESVMPSNHSSYVILFSSHLQSFRASGSFPMSQFFSSVLPMNIQDWFPLGLTGLIPLQSRDFKESSPMPQFKSINSSLLSLLHDPTLIPLYDYWKIHTFDYTDLCQQSDVFTFFNMLSGFVMAFLPRSKCLLISWLQSLSTVILEPKKIKPVAAFLPLFAMKWWDQIPWPSFFECWVLSQVFHSPLSPLSRSSLVPLSFLPLE